MVHIETWQGAKQQSDAIATSRTVKALKQAEHFLIETNARQTYKRCVGQLTTDAQGLPTFTYCQNYECWKCGQYRVWSDVQRLTAGLLHIGKAWFITLTLADATQTTYTDQQKTDFAMSVNSIMHNLRNAGKRNGHTLRYCTYYGIKQSGQIHTHIVASYLPDAVYSHNRDRYLVYVSEWLNRACERSELASHIERIQSIDGVAHYLKSNVETTLYNLPSGFQRVRFNNHWLKESDTKEMTIFVWYCLTCEQAHFTRSETDKPNRCKCCNNVSWSHAIKKHISADELPLLYTQEITHKSQITAISTLTKPCTACGEIKPLTSEYWQADTRKPDGYRSRCKECLHVHDNQRDRRFDRMCQNKAKHANRSARDYGLTDTIKPADVIAQYISQSGACAYCNADLTNGFELDHYKALVNGGQNQRDNIRCSCARCNRRKGSMTLRQWQSFMASKGQRIEGTPDTMPTAIELL